MNITIFIILILFRSLNDFCDGCDVGYYGESCSKVCPNFCYDNECNVTSGKCLSCMKGYYSDYEKDCIPCPANCTACNSNKFCFACKTGYRGEVCNDTCANCKPDTNCDKNTGYCFDNCGEGRSGELCNTQCDSKCKSCDRHNKDECIVCADGHHMEKTCNQTDRVCIITCKDLTELQPDRQGSSTSEPDTGLIVGLIGTTVIICVVCIIVYIVVRRRRTERRNVWCMFGNRNPSQTTNDDENIELLSQKARTTETRELPSAKKLTVLQLQGTFSAIEKKYDNMKIKVAENKVTVEGDPLDIENTFKQIDIKMDQVEQVKFKHSKSSEWLRFYNTNHTREYVQKKLEQNQLLGIWDINGTELTVFVFGKGICENFKNTLLESVLEISVPVDKSLLSSEWWGEFLLDNRKIFQEKVDICTKEQQDVVIICTDDVGQQVKQLVHEFLNGKLDAYRCSPGVCEFVSKYWTQDDFAEIRKTGVMIKTEAEGFKLRGLLDKLRQGKQTLSTKLNDICIKTHVLMRTGIVAVLETAKHTGTISELEKEYKCVIKLQQKNDESPSLMLSDYEVVDSEILEENQQDSSNNASPKCFQTRRHNIKIQLIQGDIVHQKADIVVGSASNSDRRSGSTFFSSLILCCPSLQTDYNRLYPNGIRDGEVAVIAPGGFNGDNICLTSLPSWEEARCNGGKVLRNSLRECLRLADKYDKNTIAFSSSVTGRYLGYPMDIAASIMYGAVVEFDSSYSQTTLEEIKIVIDNDDNETIKAFEDHEHMRIYGASSLGSLSADFADGRIKIELVTGDLFTQKVDAILCIVSSDMDLNESDIFKSLVQNGDISLQNEYKKKCNDLDFGDVADISGGKVSCTALFLTVLPPCTESYAAEKLITALQNAFRLANSRAFTSIAVPALETGYSNQTMTIAAKCMYDGAINWANKNQNASLKVVRFVMNSKDMELQRTYRICHLKTRGREMRNKRIFLEDETILLKPEEESEYRMVKDGCAIGHIQLQVQVGDLLNNTADAIVIGILNTEEQDLEKEKIVISSRAGLGAKYMFHVRFQESLAAWRGKVVECLEEASNNSLKCVAFPLIRSETGPNTFPEDGIGECLFAALADFTSQNPIASVTDVRLVVDDRNAGCIPAIIAALQNKTTAVNCQSGLGKIFKPQLGSMADTNQFKETSISVYSDASSNIDRCIKALDDRIGLQFSRKEVDVDNEFIRSLKIEQIDSIIYSDILVDVKFDDQKGKIIIVGPLRNALAAATCFYNKIRHYKMVKDSRNSAMELYNKTKWHWLSEKHVAAEMEVSYDMMTNYIVETAYKEGKQTLELQSQDGKIYRIDFQKLVEYPKTNVIDTVMVIRRDILILKGAMEKLSKLWIAMSNSENVKRVALDYGQEYKDIEKCFLKVKRNSQYASEDEYVEVVKIERIQNKILYRQYKSMKKMMKEQKSGCKPEEQQLWHEAAEENIHLIINNGFNRSYCRNHEPMYGQGVYFAADASYTAQSNRAGNNPKTKRYMFLAKVLTRELIKGNTSLRFLPPINASQPTIIYDSAVDDVQKPSQFVIFHDKQAYPKYLITYSSR